MSEYMDFMQVCVEAKKRWDETHAIAADRVASLDVEPDGIVFRVMVSQAYKEQYADAIEENDYFLQKYSDENTTLPERIKTRYGFEVEDER
jgi:hypothetical protein